MISYTFAYRCDYLFNQDSLGWILPFTYFFILSLYFVSSFLPILGIDTRFDVTWPVSKHQQCLMHSYGVFASRWDTIPICFLHIFYCRFRFSLG
jgi:hypothetical protein